VAQTAMVATHGLGNLDSQLAKSGATTMNALKAADAAGKAALTTRSADMARAASGTTFDGRGAGSAIGGGGRAAEDSYAGLDGVPMNLGTPNDTSINTMKEDPVPAFQAPMDTSQQQKMQLVMMLAGVLIGGMVGGVAGQAISMGMMMYAMTQGRSQNSGSNVSGQVKTGFYTPVRRAYGSANQYS
jgi:hypothetical protein